MAARQEPAGQPHGAGPRLIRDRRGHIYRSIHGIVRRRDSCRSSPHRVTSTSMPKPLKGERKSQAKDDLFGSADRGRSTASSHEAPRGSSESGYTARDIEVLEGLEPVRRRPGMYIGGTDEKALHHLFAEVIDNSMDEALAGHASFIDVEFTADGFITV